MGKGGGSGVKPAETNRSSCALEGVIGKSPAPAATTSFCLVPAARGAVKRENQGFVLPTEWGWGREGMREFFPSPSPISLSSPFSFRQPSSPLARRRALASFSSMEAAALATLVSSSRARLPIKGKLHPFVVFLRLSAAERCTSNKLSALHASFFGRGRCQEKKVTFLPLFSFPPPSKKTPKKQKNSRSTHPRYIQEILSQKLYIYLFIPEITFICTRFV